MSDTKQEPKIRFALPTGHMQKEVLRLLEDAGIGVHIGARAYRPTITQLPNYDTKMFKPQNLLEMLHVGSRDLGFAGVDWVKNLDVHVTELLDTGLDPVRIVAAASDPNILEIASKSGRRLVVASEYETLSRQWIQQRGINAAFVRSFGSTESFPPDDADIIIDNAATGSTLKANGLHVIDTILTSSTRLFAHPKSLEDPVKKKAIDELVVTLQSVLIGRAHLLVEFNIAKEAFDNSSAKIPCMKAPTVALLHHTDAYAVRIVVPKTRIATLIPELKQLGAEDIIISSVRQVCQ
jgi:ATP phosphoribosyltransferase